MGTYADMNGTSECKVCPVVSWSLSCAHRFAVVRFHEQDIEVFHVFAGLMDHEPPFGTIPQPNTLPICCCGIVMETAMS